MTTPLDLKKIILKIKELNILMVNTKDIAKFLKNINQKINSIFHFGEFSRIYQSFINE